MVRVKVRVRMRGVLKILKILRGATAKVTELLTISRF